MKTYSNVIENFIRYVKVDTQSLEGVEDRFPSTAKQHDLSKLLFAELNALGASNVRYDETYGYVYAQIPSNIDREVPSVGFIAHMDTSEAVSGTNVDPRIIENYDGKDIVLNEEKNIVTKVSEFPMLPNYVGKSLIVTDGTTLLGGDDKAGVAEIMALAQYCLSHPEYKHGKICIGFTPDEEVGHGVAHFDLENFGADFAYTIDGGELGDMSYECFNAAAGKLTVTGKSVHPGYSKDVMLNAIKMLNEFVMALPAEYPENTEGYEGFYHITHMHGTVEEAKADFILRDHNRAKFEERKAIFRQCAEDLNTKYGAPLFEVELMDTYNNMREVIEKQPFVVDYIKEAMKQAGVTPVFSPIRGGTDGARLTFRGLLCPNICTGSEAHHSRHEFACVEDMETIVQILINLVALTAKAE